MSPTPKREQAVTPGIMATAADTSGPGAAAGAGKGWRREVVLAVLCAIALSAVTAWYLPTAEPARRHASQAPETLMLQKQVEHLKDQLELKSALQRARTTFVFIAGLYNAGQSDFAATLRRVLPKKALTCNSNIDRSILMSGNITTAARGAELQQRIANAARTAANSSSAAHRVVLVNTCLAAGTFPIDVDNERQGVSMMKHPNLLTLYQTFQDAGLELKVIFLQNSLRISSMFAREPPAPGRVRVIADNLRVLAYYLTDYPGDIACIDAGAPTLAAAESVSRLLNVPPVPDHAADLLRRLEAQLQKREANAARAGPSRPEWEQTSIRWTWQALKEVCALPGGDAHLPREA